MIPMKTLTLDGKTYEIVDEYARQALGDRVGPTDEQIQEAINTWLDENGDSIIPTVPTKTSQLTNDSGFLTSAPVTSVNGQTGAVNITIPTVPTKTSQLTNDSGFLTSAPVTSVNGQTGAVKITIPTVPTALKNPNALIINGTSYDGSAKADITEIVNAMIETKLNALTRAEEVAF